VAEFGEAVAPYGTRGWRILHDRRLPRSPANIDHLLVGPPGVVVADSKNYRGRIRICDDGQVLVGGRPRGLEIDKVVGYARAVENATWQRFPGTPVIPLICFTQDVGLAAPIMARGAYLTQLDQLASWLEDCSQLLSPRQVWELGEHLETAHPSCSAPTPYPSAPLTPAPAGTRRRSSRRTSIMVFRLLLAALMLAFLFGFLHLITEKAVHHQVPKPTPTHAAAATSSRR
jgi:hypothetical protein